jgi:single-stranded DNA-binding protein
MKLLGLAQIGNDPELRYSSSGMAVLQLKQFRLKRD